MATSTVAHAMKMASFLLALACTIPAALAEDASIKSESDLPEWANESGMTMTLAANGATVAPIQYTVVPLTGAKGLNQSDATRGLVKIVGPMVHVDPKNIDQFKKDPPQIAYLSCNEPPSGAAMSANTLVNTLMGRQPLAIVLYSVTGNFCSLQGNNLVYDSIFSMSDAGDAGQALEFLNGTTEADVIRVAISGNVTEMNSPSGVIAREGGTTSAVAMSILYSITGLITLLFLIIIATGAFRARRYPERYGPRSAYGGRPRQSRAKGLARAVLETIPIIKFGDPQPAKPDPATYDVESVPIEPSQSNPTAKPSDTSKGPEPPAVDLKDSPAGQPEPSPVVPAGDSKTPVGDEHLGCSICTDDFSVGEDVRVLPCSHKFHPACVDPWLTNVSGTCPLCRLDLRPQGADGAEARLEGEDNALPPPLELEGTERDSFTPANPRRGSRLLDLNRLRHASPEERIQVLRQLRSEHGGQQSSDGDDRGRRARVADKLREKFKIRTRPQSPRNN